MANFYFLVVFIKCLLSFCKVFFTFKISNTNNVCEKGNWEIKLKYIWKRVLFYCCHVYFLPIFSQGFQEFLKVIQKHFYDDVVIFAYLFCIKLKQSILLTLV